MPTHLHKHRAFCNRASLMELKSTGIWVKPMPRSLTLQDILDANASFYCIVCKGGNKQMLYLKSCLKDPGSFQQAPQTCASTASSRRQGVVLKKFCPTIPCNKQVFKKPLLVAGSVGRRANLPPTGTLSNPWKEYQWFDFGAGFESVHISHKIKTLPFYKTRVSILSNLSKQRWLIHHWNHAHQISEFICSCNERCNS